MSINAAQAISAGLKLFEVGEPLTGTEWADKYFYLSAESSGIEGKWETLPYQIGPLNWMTDDDIEEFNWQKCARVGYTKCLLAATAHGIEHKRRNIVVWQPTDGDAKDFTGDEVDTMLRDVSVVGDLLRCPVGAKSKFNTVEKKVFIGATLDIKGGKSGRNYRRMTKDIAIYDETDGFDIDIDGEGSPFELGDTRIQTSSFPKSIRGSTPRIKGVSLIEAAIKSCDKVFYRFVACPQCGTLQRLEFKNLKWEGDDHLTAVFVCENGCVMTYADYPQMDASGRWQTIDGYYYDDHQDLFFDPEDTIIPRPKRIGAHIWSAYSYFTTWADTAEKWIDATNAAKTGSKAKLKTVINTRLGETYEEKGESVKSEGFQGERLDDYLAEERIPNGVLVITIGADVQGGKDSRIELEILGTGIGDESWSLDYVVIPGAPERDEVWAHLDEQFKRRFTREDGVTLGVAGGMIDSGYLPSRVFKFTAPRRARNIYATKGKAQYSGPLLGKGSWQGEKNVRAIQFPINTDEAKETIFTRLNKITEPGPGYCHFPQHYDADYFKGLTNEEKRAKYKSGVLIGHEWVKLGPNEQLDCRAENLAALARLNPNMARLKLKYEKLAKVTVLEKETEQEPQEQEEENVILKAKARKIKPRRRGGFVNGWK